MKHIFRNPLKSAIALITISAMLSIFTAGFYGYSNKNAKGLIRETEKKLSEFENEMRSSLRMFQELNSEKEKNNFFLNNSKSNSGFSYYILKNGSLVLWSDNEPAVNDSILANIKDESFLKLTNGEFLAYKRQWKDTVLVGLILIRHNYDYQNKYLVNDFNHKLNLNNNFKNAESGDTLFLPGKKGVYLLSFQPGIEKDPDSSFIILSALAVFLFLLAVYILLRRYTTSVFRFIVLSGILILVRTAMIYFKWPDAIYGQRLFDPTFYAASFYFNSLGDMLLNAVIILLLSIIIYEKARQVKRMKWMPVLYWMFTAFIVHYLIRGLVINSRLNFELSSPADINSYSILAYTSISLLLLSFLFVTAAAWRNLKSYSINGRHAWIGISICALYTAVALSQLNTEKEHETRKLLAQKAEARQDHVAEYLFREVEQKIISDTTVRQLLQSGKADELQPYILSEYLSGYLSKFIVTLEPFSEDNPRFSENLDYYRQLSATGKQTSSPDLFFINNESGGASYLALIPVEEESHRHLLVITLTPRLFRTTKGFPELLMSGNYQEATPADDYSIARYSSNALVYQYGEFVYPLKGKDFTRSENDSFVEMNGYSHLIHFINSNSFIIVSRPDTSYLGVLTLFSWMFIFMSVSAFIVFTLGTLFAGPSKWLWNLTRKVQVSVLFLVILTFTLVGTGTVFYIKSKYLNDQNKSISDQVNALWFLVNDNLFLNGPTFISENQEDQLNKLVSNTNIDFNLYNSEGRIVYSSQPKIFKKGIVSDRMNSTAFMKINDEGLTQFIHPEKAGQLRYIAAYAPFTDRNGMISAYLNLPYFEKQNELNREVSVFLSAIVNIYVLLFALAVFVTIFISSRITQPLLLIQSKLSGIRLGRMNEKIEYKPDDEIGKLVHEYNRMIDELSDSAAKLARSERESAWREMARQVAHEIKNPLTPMKLSVQHLHRTLKDGTDKAMIDRITETLITQIDSLSNIATAFSNFAKMPQAVPVKVNLKDVVSQVIDLYDESGNIKFHADDNEYFVHADRDQLTGVFSNLLKNALQAIPEDKRPDIEIHIRRQHGWITTEITDNGIGIPEDQKDKIFIPNFTTKSSGMGLGLAIARNVVEEANGKIWFTSTYGSGSTFFVSFPEE